MTFDTSSVLEHIIEERGKTLVFYINGVLVRDYTQQKNAVGDALKLNDVLPDSLELDGQQNDSKFPPNFAEVMESIARSFVTSLAIAAASGGILTIPALVRTVVNGIVSAFLQPALQDISEALYQIASDDVSASDSVNRNWTGSTQTVQKWLTNPGNSVIFTPHSQGNLYVEDGLRVINPEPSDIRLISLGSPTDYGSAGGMQDILSGQQGIYRGANIKNTDDPITFFQPAVADTKYDLVTSLAVVLLGLSTSAVPFIGVPLQLAQLFGFLSGRNIMREIVEPVVADLQANHHRVYEMMAGIQGTLTNLGELGGGGGHDLDRRYLTDPNPLKTTFEQFVHELQPKGYYFSQGVVAKNDPIINGTEKHDDWIEGGSSGNTIDGGGRNDVLKGRDGNDILIGGSGYDLLDGGDGKDTADYYSSLQGIIVSAKTIAGSDVYEVQDGFGMVDTLGNIEVISGTKSKDIFNGSDFSDIFYGQEGDDEFYGKAGNDEFYGGAGDDIGLGGDDGDDLRGEDGEDFLRGDGGNDSLYGGNGNDLLLGGDGNDDLRGENGIDRIYGENGDDLLYSGDGDDFLYGGENNDRLYGEDGIDRLFGEAGEDTIVGGAGGDIIRGGAGKDTIFGDFQNGLSASSANVVSFNFISAPSPGVNSFRTAAFSAVSFSVAAPSQLYADEIYGGEDDDTIYAGLDDDFVSGESGNDDIYGESGNDVLLGDSGTDLIAGGTGNDLISGGTEDDELWGEDGDDIINGDAGNDLIYGGEDNDTIAGGLGNDRIFGEGGNDLINGDEGNDSIFGQDGNDRLNGGIGDDYIEAGIGIDTLNGGDGTDTLFGQNGDDTLNGDAGDDFLDGGDGADKLFGGDGNDKLLGQAGNDVLYGQTGDDTLDGGAGKDYLEGNEGNDTLFGGADSDTLYGNDGDDILNGDAGTDILFGGSGNDRINGGGDVDMVSYLTSPSGVVVNIDESKNYRNDRQSNANAAINPDNPAAYYTDLEANFAINPGSAADGYGNTDTLIDLENITGSQFADVLIGNDRNNTIFGLGGDDLLVGGGGNDSFYGGNGIDTISYRRSPGGVTVNLETNSASDGAGGSDRIFDTENIIGSRFNDTLTGDVKANIITAGSGNDTVFGGAGNDTLYGETGDDTVSGGTGNDILYGNLGRDTLNGDAGDDFAYGGDGNDTLNGGDGIDQLWGDQGNDLLNGGTGDDFLDGGIGNDTLNGNDGNDQLLGQAGDDLLDGGDGNDVLSGGDGKDILYGQTGDDSLDGGLGNDQLWGGDGSDTLSGQAGDDLLDGGAGDDVLSGGDGSDRLFGQTGNDSLTGGLGDDFLDGGAGNDSLLGNEGNDQLFGQAGDDLLDGGADNDVLSGGDGNDQLFGQAGEDLLEGGLGDDLLNGGTGDDILKGNQGSDILSGGGGHDRFYINRGEGSDTILDFTGVGRGTNPAPYLVPEMDTIIFSGADLVARNMLLSQTGSSLVIDFEDIANTTVTLQNFVLENLDNHSTNTGVSLTVGNILFQGDTAIWDSFDVINANATLTQVLRPNFVTFLNDLDNKTNGFDYSNDVINGQGGNDTLRGLGGNDLLRGGEGNDILLGGAGCDILVGQWGDDYLEGGLDDDYLRGGEGNDFLTGGFGNDRLEGGLGNDQMFGAGGRDRFVIYRGDGVDTIADFDGVGPGYQPYEDIINEADILQFLGTGLIAKNMILTQTDYEPITGNRLVITFEGITDTTVKLTNFAMENLDNLSTLNSDGVPIGNILFQFDGETTIQDSFDVFNADWMFDQVLRANTVTFLNDLDNEISGFDWSDDVINGQGGNDILLGLGGNDILRGGVGNDVLIGGTGNNILTGNAGADTFVMELGGFNLVTDFNVSEDFIGLGSGLTFDQLRVEQGTGINAGSTSIRVLGDDSLLMSFQGVQANALTTEMFRPDSALYQPVTFG